MNFIPLSKPHVTGQEEAYLRESLDSRIWAGDGPFSKRCEAFLAKWAGKPVLLTSSGTHALELAMMAMNLEPGSEVILPSFTFSSTANAVLRAGLIPVFCDIRRDTLNIDETLVEKLVTPKTRALIVVHYAGVACEMNALSVIAKKHGLKLIEDAAQGIGAFYEDKPLGSIGNFGAYSFHQTKNVACGEGGALVVSDAQTLKIAEIQREKGTNRRAFLNGETDKYTWVDEGSSYLLSDVSAAFLYAQLSRMDFITAARKKIFDFYRGELAPLDGSSCSLPVIPKNCHGNSHIFYLLLESESKRDRLMHFLKKRGVGATFHYVPLHDAPAARKFGIMPTHELPVTDEVSRTLLRLPLYPDLTSQEQRRVTEAVHDFFKE